MSKNDVLISRRSFCAAASAAGLAAPFSRAWAQGQKYPSRPFSVIIPTGQGGGAERLARAFDDAWSKPLGQPFEYSFHAGASGQIGYEVFTKRRPHDGHNLLFGNMGAEMIMYAVQKPNYKFPEDFIYFGRTDIDDSCIFVKRDSPLKDIKAVVEAAKKRTLNVAGSRIPHPASIGLLSLGDATGSKYNLIPYGGGNPTYIAILNGEAEVGALPITGVLSLSDRFKVLGVFNRENIFAKQTENAPPINSIFNTNIPDLYSSRAWAITRPRWKSTISRASSVEMSANASACPRVAAFAWRSMSSSIVDVASDSRPSHMIAVRKRTFALGRGRRYTDTSLLAGGQL